jgi:hypothetical protein
MMFITEYPHPQLSMPADMARAKGPVSPERCRALRHAGSSNSRAGPAGSRMQPRALNELNVHPRLKTK